MWCLLLGEIVDLCTPDRGEMCSKFPWTKTEPYNNSSFIIWRLGILILIIKKMNPQK